MVRTKYNSKKGARVSALRGPDWTIMNIRTELEARFVEYTSFCIRLHGLQLQTASSRSIEFYRRMKDVDTPGTRT